MPLQNTSATTRPSRVFAGLDLRHVSSYVLHQILVAATHELIERGAPTVSVVEAEPVTRTPAALQCPWCGKLVDGLVELEAHDVVLNQGELQTTDDDELVLGVSQSDADAHTLAWLCPECGEHVSLPDDVDVSYD